MTPAECWELHPPGKSGLVDGGESDPGASRWIERFATLHDLCDRLAWLAWGAVDQDFGGRTPADEPPAGQARKDDLTPALRKRLAQPEKDPNKEAKRHAILTGDDLRQVFPVGPNEPFRRWGPGVRQCLRVRGPGETEPTPWYLSSSVLQRVLALTAGAERLHSTIAMRCGPSDLGGHANGEQHSTRPGPDIYIQGTELEAIIRAMLTRPMVLLAGVSGSGKTQIAKRLGKAWANGWFDCGFDKKNKLRKDAVSRVWDGFTTTPKSGGGSKQPYFIVDEHGHPVTRKLIPSDWYRIQDGFDPAASPRPLFGVVAVQSDWTDASHLWGYHVPLPATAEGFYGTAALRVFLSANQSGGRPACVVLDEMNLSRPEHYGSDLLSAMELIGEDDGDVIELHRQGTAVRLRGELHEGTPASVPARTRWPDRMLVLGTVNVDETTFSFAPKVLDRAALLEFVEVDLRKVYSARNRGDVEWMCDLNSVLKSQNLHIAYRAAKEILNSLEAATDSKAARDQQLCNKVLPRIRGPRASVETILFDLRKKACEIYGDDNPEKLSDLRKTLLDREPKSLAARKIDQMLHRATTIGFTSFFG